MVLRCLPWLVRLDSWPVHHYWLLAEVGPVVVRTLIGVVADLAFDGEACLILLHPVVTAEPPLVGVVVHQSNLAILLLGTVLYLHLLGFLITDDAMIDRLLQLSLLIWVGAGVVNIVEPRDPEASCRGRIHLLSDGLLLLGLS